MDRSWRRVWLLAIGFWTTIGLIAVSQDLASSFVYGRSAPGVQGMILTFFSWWYWAVVTPFIVWVAWVIRPGRVGWRWSLAGHAVACVGLTGLQVASILADLLIREWRPPLAIGWGGAVQLIALSRIVPDALIYVAVLGTGSALYYYGSFRERELLASRLETQLAESRLAVLRLQLNPHFLFNTLNTVASQIRVRREDGALRMLDRLGELLRRALNPAQQTETVLAEELRFLSCYAEIEKERFGDRLEILVSVDPEVLAARRPLKKSPFPLAASGEGR